MSLHSLPNLEVPQYRFNIYFNTYKYAHKYIIMYLLSKNFYVQNG